MTGDNQLPTPMMYVNLKTPMNTKNAIDFTMNIPGVPDWGWHMQIIIEQDVFHRCICSPLYVPSRT